MSDELVELVERAAAQLGEHFDAVEILASVGCDGGLTRCVKRGVGNWYARQGMAHEFIQSDIAHEQALAIQELNPEE